MNSKEANGLLDDYLEWCDIVTQLFRNHASKAEIYRNRSARDTARKTIIDAMSAKHVTKRFPHCYICGEVKTLDDRLICSGCYDRLFGAKSVDIDDVRRWTDLGDGMMLPCWNTHPSGTDNTDMPIS